MYVRLALLLVLLFAEAAAAQDNHYWTNQFGSRSALLGGAVVGGVMDTSATYYNPARMAFFTNDSLSVSADVYQFDSLTVDNGGGAGIPLNSSKGRIIPLAISGIWLFDGADGHAFGYSVIERHDWSIGASARRVAQLNVIDDSRSAGLENYVGQYSFDSSLEEAWAGITYAYRFTEHFSMGITTYAALRFEEVEESVSTRATTAAGAGAGTIYGAENSIGVDYWNLRLIHKIGAALDIGFLKIGFTLTTPSTNIVGLGKVFRQLSVIGLDIDGTPASGEDLEVNDRRDSVPTEFRSPFSIASGLSWKIRSTVLHFTWEWFLAVGRYTVLKPVSRTLTEPNVPVAIAAGLLESDDSGRFLRVVDGRRAVFNIAVAVETDFSDHVRGVWSVRGDSSADYLHRGPEFALGIAKWDLVHFATGVIVRLYNDDDAMKSEITLGVQFSGGNSIEPQPVNFDLPTEGALLLGTPAVGNFSYVSVGLIIGWTYFF